MQHSEHAMFSFIIKILLNVVWHWSGLGMLNVRSACMVTQIHNQLVFKTKILNLKRSRD